MSTENPTEANPYDPDDLSTYPLMAFYRRVPQGGWALVHFFNMAGFETMDAWRQDAILDRIAAGPCCGIRVIGLKNVKSALTQEEFSELSKFSKINYK